MNDDFTPTLFENSAPRPLADRMRPGSLENIAGQEHLLGPDAPLRKMLASGRISSFILWGPPGCGKTTLARILAKQTNMHYIALSAVFSGIAELKKAFQEARNYRTAGRGTLLFVDEIHRFNRTQQDGFLPYVEDGTVILVGATTENPSFELNSALLSRCKVFVMKRLDENALETLIKRSEELLNKKLPVDDAARKELCHMADGDGRYLINLLETVYQLAPAEKIMTPDELANLVQKRPPLYDKDRDGHYNLISALHKSLRGSDPDAALYWAARMVAGGEDPLYLLRRLTRFAMEDVGLADPQVLPMAIAAWDAYERLGSPEGDIAISELVVRLATAPKSNACYKAWKEVMKTARETGSLTPPNNILNAPTKLMKDLGYNKGYQYDHDDPDGFSGANYFPEEMGRRIFYKPVNRGYEQEIAKRLRYWDDLRKQKNSEI